MGTGNAGSCQIITDDNPYADGVIHRQSRIQLGVGIRGTRPARPSRDGARLVAKIGVLLERGQRIVSWELRIPEVDVRAQPTEHRDVTAQLNQFLPLPFLQWLSHKWVGYRVDFGEFILGDAELGSDMHITFNRLKDKRFQTVPMVFGFESQPFGDHFILGLTILQAASDQTRFDTNISGR